MASPPPDDCRRPARRAWGRAHLRVALVAAVALLLTIAGAQGAHAAICAPDGADDAQVLAAQRAVAAACDCGSAESRSAWRGCVMPVLAARRDAGALSRSCMAHVLRFEMDSTCGRPGAVVCCRSVRDGLYSTTLTSSIRPASACDGPGDFVSPLTHEAESCFADPPDRLTSPERCGNARPDEGEECDPPDEVSCSGWCGRCPDAPGALTLACTDALTRVSVAAVPDTFLVAFSGHYRARTRALVARLDPQGQPKEATVAIGDRLRRSRRMPASTVAEAATADDTGFRVAFNSTGVHVRRVPPVGPVTGPAEYLFTYAQIGADVGSCRGGRVGPLELAASADGSGVRYTQRYNIALDCGFPEYIDGVPFEFHPFPPWPIVGSAGPGRLARGTSDVAALWWVYEWRTESAMTPRATLYGGWIDPAPESAFPLVAGGIVRGAPGLAALGDTFLAVYANPAGDGLLAIRFSRSGGQLDAAPGMPLVSGLEGATDVIATSDGERFVVAWKEESAPGRDLIRLLRVAVDGRVLDQQPVDALEVRRFVEVGVAAEASSILLVYPERLDDDYLTAVRAVVVPN